MDNDQLEQFEEKSKTSEEKKKKEKKMKTSGKQIFDLQRIMKEKNEEKNE